MNLLSRFWRKNSEKNQNEESENNNLDDRLLEESDETIHDAIINKFRDIEDNIKEGHDFFGYKYKRLEFEVLPAQTDYRKINFKPYAQTVKLLGERIGFLDECYDESVKFQKEDSEDKGSSSMERAMYYLCRAEKYSYAKGDTWASFLKKNKNNKSYNSNSDVSKEKFKNLFMIMVGASTEEAQEKQELEATGTIIRGMKETTLDLVANLKFIDEFKIKPETAMPVDEVNDLLIDLLYGNINKSRVLKEIKKWEEAETAQKRAEKFKTAETQNEVQKNQNVFQSEAQEYAPSKTHNLEFFQKRGITGPSLRKLKMDDEKYGSAKTFVSSLETILANAGIEKNQVRILIQKNQDLLFETKEYMSSYIDLLEELYNIIDPKTVSGLNPSNNSEIYKSKEALRCLILREKSKAKNINVFNEDIITNEKDRKLFVERVKTDVFQDEQIKKYISRKANQKTLLYNKYSKMAGEGNYRKGKFGGRRVIYKVEREESAFNVFVINYFEKHKYHTDSFK